MMDRSWPQVKFYAIEIQSSTILAKLIKMMSTAKWNGNDSSFAGFFFPAVERKETAI